MRASGESVLVRHYATCCFLRWQVVRSPRNYVPLFLSAGPLFSHQRSAHIPLPSHACYLPCSTNPLHLIIFIISVEKYMLWNLSQQNDIYISTSYQVVLGGDNTRVYNNNCRNVIQTLYYLGYRKIEKVRKFCISTTTPPPQPFRIKHNFIYPQLQSFLQILLISLQSFVHTKF
jgi:hypothetical protein